MEAITNAFTRKTQEIIDVASGEALTNALTSLGWVWRSAPPRSEFRNILLNAIGKLFQDSIRVVISATALSSNRINRDLSDAVSARMIAKEGFSLAQASFNWFDYYVHGGAVENRRPRFESARRQLISLDTDIQNHIDTAFDVMNVHLSNVNEAITQGSAAFDLEGQAPRNLPEATERRLDPQRR